MLIFSVRIRWQHSTTSALRIHHKPETVTSLNQKKPNGFEVLQVTSSKTHIHQVPSCLYTSVDFIQFSLQDSRLFASLTRRVITRFVFSGDQHIIVTGGQSPGGTKSRSPVNNPCHDHGPGNWSATHLNKFNDLRTFSDIPSFFSSSKASRNCALSFLTVI